MILNDNHGTAIRVSDVRSMNNVAGSGGLYNASATWPKVYGNSTWCGEFKSKYSTEVTP